MKGRVNRVLRRLKPRKPERMPEGRQIAIGMIVTLGVFIGVCIALAKIPALQLDPPAVRSAALTVKPTGGASKPVKATYKCLDDPSHGPPCSAWRGGIGRQ